MRVFSGGVLTETNTFAPFPTGLADYHVRRGHEFDPNGGDSDYGNASRVWYELCQARGWEFCPGLLAYAQPAGITPRPVYEALRDEMLADLEAALPVDMVLLTLHGAMVAEGYDDCETDIVHRVREIVGPDVIVGAEFDLHSDLTDQLMAEADAIVLYKEYPHTDIADRAVELFDICARALAGAIRPVMARFDCRMIGFFLTPYEPMRSFVDAMSAAEKRPGVLSVSLFHTFPWGDVPTCSAQILAITDNDPDLAQTVAAEFGRQFFALRHETQINSLPMNEALDKALANPRGPVVVADQADNAGGGAPSDSTFVLRELLARGVTDAAIGMFWDPIAVRVAQAAGEGARLQLRLGGKMGPMSGDPLDLEVTVTRIREGMFQEWPQGENPPIRQFVGDAVALHCQGIDIVVNTERGQVFGPMAFSELDIDLASKRLIVVKSTQHFYAGFAPLASEIVYMSAPGAIAPRFTEIPYERVDRHKFPWVDNPFNE